MTDSISIDKLALSSTFAFCQGKLVPAEASGSVFSDNQLLAPDFIVDGKYRIIKLIGEGGMGCVYHVHHQQLQKDMALKTIIKHNRAGESWQRFQREVRAISKLRHRSIVEVFDFGIADGGMPYYTMELLQGENLSDILDCQGTFEPTYAIRLFLQVAEALAHAHKSHILHRDIKPANIFVTSSFGQSGVPLVKIVDFGLAKLAADDDQYLTSVGAIFGSPLYMSPEQSMAQAVDQRSDIYSFACALFHTIAGAPPFVGENAFITLLGHQQQEIPSLSTVYPRIKSSQRLESVMKKMLAKRPEDRFETFEQICDELNACLGALEVIASTASSVKRPILKFSSSTFIEKPDRKNNWLRPTSLVFVASVFVSLGFYVCQTFLRSASSKPAAVAQRSLVGRAQSPSSHSIVEGQKVLISPPTYFTELTRRSPDGFQKTIVFPEGDNHAEIRNFKTTTIKRCTGEITFPAAARLSLTCYDGCTPAFLQRFNPGDLYSLKLSAVSDGDWTEKHLKAISHLTGLIKLDLSDSEFDAGAIKYINKLSGLTQLNIANSRIRGRDLLNLTSLKNYEILEASNTKGLSDLIHNYPQPSRLKDLRARSCGLTDSDMPFLARQKQLTALGLEDNCISINGLRYLVPLSRLKFLEVSGMPAGPEAIEPLSHFPELATLGISHSSWTAEQIELLKKALPPKCRVKPNVCHLVDP